MATSAKVVKVRGSRGETPHHRVGGPTRAIGVWHQPTEARVRRRPAAPMASAQELRRGYGVDGRRAIVAQDGDAMHCARLGRQRCETSVCSSSNGKLRLRTGRRPKIMLSLPPARSALVVVRALPVLAFRLTPPSRRSGVFFCGLGGLRPWRSRGGALVVVINAVGMAVRTCSGVRRRPRGGRPSVAAGPNLSSARALSAT